MPSNPILLYDGVCGLCNRFVRFILKHDHKDRFRFAALQSNFARAILERHGLNPDVLDTVYLVFDYGLPSERLLSRNEAATAVLERIRRLLAILGGIAGFVAKTISQLALRLDRKKPLSLFRKVRNLPAAQGERPPQISGCGMVGDKFTAIHSRMPFRIIFSPRTPKCPTSQPCTLPIPTSTPRCKNSAVSNAPSTSASTPTSRAPEEYDRIYRESVEQPEKFWGRIAAELHWFKKWDKVLEWNHPWAKWFIGGQINLSYNCLDRHVQTARKNKAAIIWESEPGEVRTLTYQQLHREVQKFANVLKSLGVRKGDRVAIYMGMTPELPSRCWPAPASARRTPSSSADFPPTRWSIASTIRRPPPSSRRMAPIRRGAEVKLFRPSKKR